MLIVLINITNAASSSSQLKRLLEFSELRMITELRHQLSKDTTALMTERSRSEESVLPLDLWTPSQHHGGTGGGGDAGNTGGAASDEMMISQPSMYEEFVSRLMSDCTRHPDGSVTFSNRHLKASLGKLASGIIVRFVRWR